MKTNFFLRIVFANLLIFPVKNNRMKKICLLPLLLTIIIFDTTTAQEKEIYPDSLKGIILKIEPLSFLFDHLSGGIEVPVGKNFLDINIGASGLGVANYYNQTGGFVMKAGMKLPIVMRSPFSILYLMPEIAYSTYKKTYYDPATYADKRKTINASAIMLCLGYRHISPVSKFYYDGGVDLGIGWANQGEAYNNYNFNLPSSRDNYYNNMKSSISGAALSCHFAVGFLLKRKPVR